MCLPFLSSLVRGPAFVRRRDVLSLPSFRAATDQDHKAVAILAGNWAEVDLAFKNAETNALDLREISLLHARKRDRHPGGGRGIESVEPLGESFDSAFVDVAADLDQPKRMVTNVLPLVEHVTFHLRHRRPLRTAPETG